MIDDMANANVRGSGLLVQREGTEVRLIVSCADDAAAIAFYERACAEARAGTLTLEFQPRESGGIMSADAIRHRRARDRDADRGEMAAVGEADGGHAMWTNLAKKSRWHHGRWADSLGIGRGLEGCEGRTIEAVAPFELFRDEQPCEGCDAYGCSWRTSAFVRFTDGTRRLLETSRAWMPMEEYAPLVEAGILTVEDARRIEAGRAAETAADDAETQRRRHAEAAAKAAYEAAYRATEGP